MILWRFASLTAFTVLVGGVYVGAALALWRAWRSRKPGRPKIGRFDKLMLGLAAVGTLCILDGLYVEPWWPEVTHTTLVTDRLPAGGASVRIVHLSDIHSEAQVRLEERLPALVAAEKPDIITFSGDSVNNFAGLQTFRACLTALARIAPTYVVRGNWDMLPQYRPPTDLFDGTGAVELVASAHRLRLHGADVAISGTSYSHGGQIQGAVDELPAQGLRLFVYHLPDEIGRAVGKADLYLAGHTHGGQVRLPIYGAVVTMSRFGKRYEAGLYQEGPTWLYVSRGIGMEGGGAPPVRFLCRPEIAVIDLVPPASQATP